MKKVKLGGRTALSLLKHYKPHWKTVSDASEDLVMEVSQADVNGANQKDPNGCAMAQACKRNGFECLIYAHRAFIARNGSSEVKRYRNSAKLIRAIEVYDRTGKWDAAGLFVLAAPCDSHKLGTPKKNKPNATPRLRKQRRLVPRETLGVRRFE